MTNSYSKGTVEGTLANIATETIDRDTTYSITDYPIGGITTAQMTAALTDAQKPLYKIGSVYVCTDDGTVSGVAWTKGLLAKFMGNYWEAVKTTADDNISVFKTISKYVSKITCTVTANQFYTIPIVSSSQIFIDWGDGECEYYRNATTLLSHTWATAGNYTIRIYGDFNGLNNLTGDDAGTTSLFGSVVTGIWYGENITTLSNPIGNHLPSLVEVHLPAVNIINTSVLQYCTGLEILDIPMLRLIQSGNFYAFWFNSGRNPYSGDVTENVGLTQLNLPTTLRRIGNPSTEVGFGRMNTHKVIIPEKVEYMCSYAIAPNDNILKTVVFKPITPPTFADTYSIRNAGDEEIPAGLTILVPYSSLQAYKTATNFTVYANLIYPIGGQYSETVTIASTDWTLNSTTNLYEATATVVGATNESRNILDWSLVDSNGNQIEDTYGLGAKTQGSMSITFTAETAPTDAINIFVQSTLTNYQE